jgi:menaquinol-cytochrome c reductase iron-sulfur subunit
MKKNLMNDSEKNNNQCGCSFGCCGGEPSARRSFLKKTIGILSTPLLVFLAWPFVQSIVGTIFRLPRTTFENVGPVNSFPDNEPALSKYESTIEEAYLHEEKLRDVWIIKHSDSKVTVFSPICPHLGCHYDWYPESKKFICPCHGSVFSIDGKVLGGPSPRGLDTLPWKIENGDVYIKWEQYRVGIPQKIRVG